MDNRTRILKLMAGEKIDRIPWFADLAYWRQAMETKGDLPEMYQGDGVFQLSRDHHVGFYLQGFEPFNAISDIQVESETKDETSTTTIITPKGNLTQITKYLPISYSSGFIKHFVETKDDLPAFSYFIDSLRYEPAYDEAHRRKPLIGDNGVLLCYTPKSPFMQMATAYMGVENLSYLIADFPDEADRLLEKIRVKSDIAARMAVDSPAEFIMIPENLSSEVVGQTYYMDYLRPYEKYWTDEIRKVGKTSLIHMDGTLKGLIGCVSEAGFDIIEAVTPAPVGDITMEEVSDIVNGRSIVWGGVPGALFCPSTPLDVFAEHVKHMLSIMRKFPRYVLGVADQVPPDGEMDRLKIVAALCDEFGQYE